jgi:enterochelin esterase-like enzyme
MIQPIFLPMIQTLILILALLGLSFQGIAQQPIPQVASGRIERIQHFRSQYVALRHIDVWLPEGYSDTVKYAVLYMHDGQMLFDSAITWNRQAWNVDDVATELFASGQVKKFIVVGIWNSGPTRHAEYFPQKPFERLSQTEKDSVNAQLQRAGRTQEAFNPTSDNYLRFIVHELKPYIDTNFSVHTDRENTFMAGSSMGGLISLYALLEYPKVFGGVACLSTHWASLHQSRARYKPF